MLPRFLFPATDKTLTAKAAVAIVAKHETAKADERRERAKAESAYGVAFIAAERDPTPATRAAVQKAEAALVQRRAAIANREIGLAAARQLQAEAVAREANVATVGQWKETDEAIADRLGAAVEMKHLTSELKVQADRFVAASEKIALVCPALDATKRQIFLEAALLDSSNCHMALRTELAKSGFAWAVGIYRSLIPQFPELIDRVRTANGLVASWRPAPTTDASAAE